MNRRQFEQYLRQQGCLPHREGGNHTIWMHSATHQKAPVPRHTPNMLSEAPHCHLSLPPVFVRRLLQL